MADLDAFIAARRSKLDRLAARGVVAYPWSFAFTHRVDAVHRDFADAGPEESASNVAVCGRIVAWRGHGKTAFAHLEDATGRLQFYCRLDAMGEVAFAALEDLDVGDFAGVRGRVFRTKTGELTVKAASVELLAKALRPLPEKWHGLKDEELRWRHRAVDLAANADSRRVFRIRARATALIREFLDVRGYLEVETPVLQPLYGGAEATPFTTHYESLDATFYLRISNELYLKRLLVGGLDRVYEFSRNFRNEGLDRTHSPEFTLLELYEAYADYEDMMRLTEELFRHVVTGVNRAFNGTDATTLPYQGATLEFGSPWPRIAFVPALAAKLGFDPLGATLETLRGAARAARVADVDRHSRPKLLDKLFSALIQDGLTGPAFVTDHPVELSPLAKSHRNDPRLVERFEPIIAGFEIGNAFSELNDPGEQRRRFEAQGALRAAGDTETHALDEDYLAALEQGMPPAGGLGIGMDRLIMLLCDVTTIRDVILFPQLRPDAP